ncbi:MAG TPA: ABC transporter permease [Chitinophagaceae bacterium]|nr:ABC transporter permease [Chitinophagaceae bacterium]
MSQTRIDSLQENTNLQFNTLSGTNSDTKSTVASIAGYISGFLIYLILFIYGTMVMRGVMEEKVSRIAEVIVSSVKPYQLMLGKIFSIGAVGLVQFLIWIAIVFGLSLMLPFIFPGLAGHAAEIQTAVPNAGAQSAAAIQSAAETPGFIQGLSEVNFPLIISCFVFYFLGGYLLYSSLFAAVGSAVNEDPQDAQTLVLPITMPIIFSFVILSKAINDPGSGLAIFGSLFPLTSPIVMMGRVTQGVPDAVPVWQLLLSMAFLIIGFLATTWLAAKIYRTGILMYGKKITWKEMWKWALRKS